MDPEEQTVPWLVRVLSSKLAKQIVTVVLIEIAGALAKKRKRGR